MINGADFAYPFRVEVVVLEEADSSILGILNDAVPAAEQSFANDMITVNFATVMVNRENVEASFEKGTQSREKSFLAKSHVFCVSCTLAHVNRLTCNS